VNGITIPTLSDLGVRLLRGIFGVFEARATDRRIPATVKEKLSTAHLIDALLEDKEQGWATAFGQGKRPLDSQTLARTLKPFGLRSKDVWFPGNTVVKGYERPDFADTWLRYGIGPLGGLGANESADLGAETDPLGTPPPSGCETNATTEKHSDLADLADKTPPTGGAAAAAHEFTGPLPEPGAPDDPAAELLPEPERLASPASGSTRVPAMPGAPTTGDNGNGYGRAGDFSIPDADLTDAEFALRHGCSVRDLQP
jgi:hypothetical protein